MEVAYHVTELGVAEFTLLLPDGDVVSTPCHDLVHTRKQRLLVVVLSHRETCSLR